MITPRSSRLHINAPLLNALRRSLPDEHGAAIVETAISMVVLMTLIFGVIQISWAIYAFHYVANTAHEGARYAIVRGSDWTTSCPNFGSSRCNASTAQIASFVSSRSVLGISIDPTDVCVQYFSTVPASTSSSCTPNSSPNAAGNIVQVTVSYPFTLNIPGVPSKTFNLASTSQMVISQ